MLSSTHTGHLPVFCSPAYLTHHLGALLPSDAEIPVKPSRSFGVVDILQSREQDKSSREQRTQQLLATHYDHAAASNDEGSDSGAKVVRSPNHHAMATTNIKSIQLRFGIDKILSDEVKPRKTVRHSSNDSLVEMNEQPKHTSMCASQSSMLYPALVSAQAAVLYPNPVYTHHAHPAESSHHYHHPIYNEQSHSYQGPYTMLTQHHESWRPIYSQQTHTKRKRSWSRAVFTNLQRKGLEKRFEIQKYVTKPDRRQLAAALGLTDAQVKVWFQNRRMKWRHSKESQPKKNADAKESDSQEHKENTDLTDSEDDEKSSDTKDPEQICVE